MGNFEVPDVSIPGESLKVFGENIRNANAISSIKPDAAAGHDGIPAILLLSQHICLFSRARVLTERTDCVRFLRGARVHRDILV
jgi:hypothetical protein